MGESIPRHKKQYRRRLEHRNIGYVPEIGWCEEHEKRWFDKKNAKRVIRVMAEAGMRPYRCGLPMTEGFWHVGHLDVRVRKGAATADEIYGDEGSY